MSDMSRKPEEFWKAKLSPEQYRVLREKGTEPAFSGKYVDNHTDGIYRCAACGIDLFASDTKFDSRSGWPSFDKPMNLQHITLLTDNSHGMIRTEVQCKNCGSHLGHVFPDGPKNLPDGRQATGERYCINSCALDFSENGSKT